MFSGLDQSINAQSIKDSFRLGRFTANKKLPRPLLVKFVRAADASCVLSKRGLLPHPVMIKPDMSPEERTKESLLLKERWSLIQAGVPRNIIKIRNCRLFVNNKLHGQVTLSGFQPVCNSRSDVNTSITQSSSSIVQEDHQSCQLVRASLVPNESTSVSLTQPTQTPMSLSVSAGQITTSGFQPVCNTLSDVNNSVTQSSLPIVQEDLQSGQLVRASSVPNESNISPVDNIYSPTAKSSINSTSIVPASTSVSPTQASMSHPVSAASLPSPAPASSQ